MKILSILKCHIKAFEEFWVIHSEHNLKTASEFEQDHFDCLRVRTTVGMGRSRHLTLSTWTSHKKEIILNWGIQLTFSKKRALLGYFFFKCWLKYFTIAVGLFKLLAIIQVSKRVKTLHMYRVWFGISGSKSVFLNPIFYGNFVCLRSESVTNHPDGSLFVKPEKILITLSK